MPTPALSDDVCRTTLELYAEHGNQFAAAEAAGVSRTTFQSRLIEAKRRFGANDPRLEFAYLPKGDT